MIVRAHELHPGDVELFRGVTTLMVAWLNCETATTSEQFELSEISSFDLDLAERVPRTSKGTVLSDDGNVRTFIYAGGSRFDLACRS